MIGPRCTGSELLFGKREDARGSADHGLRQTGRTRQEVIGEVTRRRDLRSEECGVALALGKLLRGDQRGTRELRAAADDARELEERNGAGKCRTRVSAHLLDDVASG